MAPINPETQKNLASRQSWTGAQGLAEDVQYYGDWMKQEAFGRIGHLYPKVRLDDGSDATVIAWLWARTVKCPNPICGCDVPLASSFDLSKKNGHEFHSVPDYSSGHLTFSVHPGKSPIAGTVNRKGAICIHCNTPIAFDYIRDEANLSHMKNALMGIVAEGDHGRVYINPNLEHFEISQVPIPEEVPLASLPEKALGFRVQRYGMDKYYKLFTDRQLTMLTTFSDLVSEATEKVLQDARAAGMENAEVYGKIIAVYLALVVDRLADRHSSLCSWDVTRDGVRNTFGRQALPMVWDYAEANPFCSSSGSFDNMLGWVIKSIESLPANPKGEASQWNAQEDCGLRNVVVSTDPPYYDNIGYADLSDFFYVWMRRSLRPLFPDLFSTMLVPKAEELVATPYRFDGRKDSAKEFFENGMEATCRRLFEYTRDDIPLTIYYAYKQSEAKSADGASGWETMLSAIIRAGFQITGTWPIRTEMANRTVATGTNALASSIVLVCRKRPTDAGIASKRDFTSALRAALPKELETLQSSNIAPVDMAQASIGKGMAVFSQFTEVQEANGTPITIRTALEIINEELDTYLTNQGTGLDADTRFCVDIYTQWGFGTVNYGEAEVLSKAKNTDIEALAHSHVLNADRGIVRLLTREEIPEDIGKNEPIWLLAQRLTRAMEQDGIQGTAKIVTSIAKTNSSASDMAKDLVYRLFTIAEKNGWQSEALAYNNLATSWADVKAAVRELRQGQQLSLT